ncbi:hypothetical protein HYALB_00002282 [Hymenoscyphus albidus]|uniref:N-acetylgalactosaminide beta-1,3-galactosyltransferase n=1 Tax=Hymenoscyphus albidus TaxID=595503 RepID=A0A9N9QCH1_9HELO|nr:hypothetical protein HYALB_00002282 [Hymenoscyphus albidus]
MIRGVRSPFTKLRITIIGTLLVSAYYLLLYSAETRLPGKELPTYSLRYPTNSESCIDTPASKKIVVSIKTGASEAVEKIPAQMQTALRCAKNVFFFSDLEQDLRQFHVHDALDTIPVSVAGANPDFDFYNKQYQRWRNGEDVSSREGAKNPEAWTLDKYKFIHSLEKTWALKPDMDWYVLIDADTYVFWSNLLQWLETMDPMKKSYFGSEVVISGQRFAHGGSGIVLSKAAMYDIVVKNNGTAAQWDTKTHDRCCGDLVLGLALKEHGIELQDVWPSFSGETPKTMPFGPGTPEYLCRPALTMHHVSPADMTDLSEYEQQRGNRSACLLLLEPLTHIELFKSLTLDSVRAQAQRENWDNLASDPGEYGKTGGVLSKAKSLEECAKACEADKECFQYGFHGKCHIGRSIRLGQMRDPDEDGTWQSGWNHARLNEWVLSQPVCEQVNFPRQGSECPWYKEPALGDRPNTTKD